MRFLLLATELGLVLLDENMKPVSSRRFAAEERSRKFLAASSGELGEDEISWLKGQASKNDIVETDNVLMKSLSSLGFNVSQIPENTQRETSRNRLAILVDGSLASSQEEAEDALRKVSLEISDLRVREKSSKPDLQAMESVQALDEIDKTANILASRLREWYGLHFPEITSLVDDNISLAKLIVTFNTRDRFDSEELEKMGYSKNKASAIVAAAKQSRGADLREEDISRIVQIAEEAQKLFTLRDRLATHVEKTMRQVAPNLSEVAGASIGARLIAKAGGLEKLALMPASTIQILGAEKALYRALKSGGRPPKHGVLFQHAEVHSAPKWQRGKIARSVAGKIAIASRVDLYRGSKDEAVINSLKSRLDEIRSKYKEPPEEKPFTPRREPQFRRFREKAVAPPQKTFQPRKEKMNRRERRKGLQRKTAG